MTLDNMLSKNNNTINYSCNYAMRTRKWIQMTLNMCYHRSSFKVHVMASMFTFSHLFNSRKVTKTMNLYTEDPSAIIGAIRQGFEVGLHRAFVGRS